MLPSLILKASKVLCRCVTLIRNALSRFQDKSILVLRGSAFKMAVSAPASVSAAPLPDDFYFSTLHLEQSMEASQRRQADTVDDSILEKGNRRKKRLGVTVASSAATSVLGGATQQEERQHLFEGATAGCSPAFLLWD